MINILYQSPWRVGGSTAYTVHLYNILHPHARIIRIGKRTEAKPRPMAGYGVDYQIIDEAELHNRMKNEAVLLAAADPKFDVYLDGMWRVFHDPNEFKIYQHWKDSDGEKVICIRETGLRYFPKGRFIPHPYVRRYENRHPGLHPHLACSVARVSSVKNAHWIMAANERLPLERCVILYGEPNRQWFWSSSLVEKYPSLNDTLRGPFEKYFHADAELCRCAKYSVDLTIFKGDGGGTQYSFLAAMDAGSVPVISADWASYPGPAAMFGLTIKNEDDLYEFLSHDEDERDRRKFVEQNWRFLDKVHNPTKIAAEYLKLLT
jgi:hypothetical protein